MWGKSAGITHEVKPEERVMHDNEHLNGTTHHTDLCTLAKVNCGATRILCM